MKILLDSDIISALCKPYEEENHYKALTFIDSFEKEPDICISIITFYEIYYGIHADNDEERKKRVRNFLENAKTEFIKIPLDYKDSEIYGDLKHSFQVKTGMNQKALKRHNIDIILASQAIANDCILISQDKIYSEHLKSVDSRLQHQFWKT